MIRGFTRGFKPPVALAGDEILGIHRGAPHTGQNSGMQTEHGHLLHPIAQHGCRADFDAPQPKFPSALAQVRLQAYLRSERLQAWNRERDLMVGGVSWQEKETEPG